ncbi:hypothetical protein RNJ44_04361 [Nakaseomyces bracarensis]|uniref:Uncharacterized protein n=1 Tax=Nakaseomyces bracarensis TaxID=273131 RepID=A0ABR4NUQ0_9SACH
MYLLLFLTFLVGLVVGNTESVLINVPKGFNAISNGDSQFHMLDMGHRLVSKRTIEFEVDSVRPYQVVELSNVQSRKNYQIKVCWSAIEGYDIRDVGYVMAHSGQDINIPDVGSLGLAKSDSIFLYFRVDQDTYPRIPDGYKTEVNLSVVNLVAYIPIDCMPMIFFLALAILPFIYILRTNKHMDLFR